MWYLLSASLVWAVSFGLIKHMLVGVGMDPTLVAFVRLLLSALLFAPFMRPRAVGCRTAGLLVVIGCVQYGVMYLLYLASYRYLAAHQVALFTIFTPIYVTAIHDLRTRRFHRLFLLTSLLAVAGTAVLLAWGQGDVRGALAGVLLLQGANICFAAGQVWYRDLLRARPHLCDAHVFGLLYLGAVLATVIPAVGAFDARTFSCSAAQALTLLYLGLVPSGIGFYLWNAGSRRVNAGTLSAMNNAKVPLAVLCSLLLFGEEAAWLPLLVGGASVFAAAWINARADRLSRSP